MYSTENASRALPNFNIIYYSTFCAGDKKKTIRNGSSGKQRAFYPV